MNLFFFAILTAFLFILQTVVLPSFSWSAQCFDLLIIEVLYLSLTAGRRSVVIAIVLIGAIMDSASGVPFFFHIFSYMWIYLIVQMVNQFLFQRSMVFILIISMVGVMIQQGLVVLSIFIQQGSQAVFELNFGLMVHQVFWGLVFIPISIWVVNIMRVNGIQWMTYTKKRMIRKYKGEL